MKSETPQSLPLLVREWLALALLVGLITGLALLTSIRSSYLKKNDGQFFTDRKEFIEVFVKGAVDYPGAYQIPKHLTLKDLLDTARVHPGADLRRFNLEKTLRNGRLLSIKMRPTITVFFSGSVSMPGTIYLPKMQGSFSCKRNAN
jgi:hypothetical protein